MCNVLVHVIVFVVKGKRDRSFLFLNVCVCALVQMFACVRVYDHVSMCISVFSICQTSK